MKVKTLVTFPRKTLKLIEKGRNIFTAITTNPYFKDVSPECAALVQQLAAKLLAVKNAYDEAAAHDSNKIAARKQQEQELVTLLVDISRHIESFAKGDAKILESSGFDVTHESTRKISYPLIAAMITLQHGKEGNSIVVKGKRLPGAWRYETWITDDPAGLERWQLAHDTPKCSHLVIGDVIPGTLYGVRMRGIWEEGPGPWSIVATIRAL
jgi:hypothetical protein